MDLLHNNKKFTFVLKNNKTIQKIKAISGQTKNTH